MKKRSFLALLLVLMLVVPLVPASAASNYFVNAASVKVRVKPNYNAKVLDSYRRDYAVVSFKKYDANWAYVSFSNGFEGYVQSKYLKAGKSTTGYIKKDETALRSGPAVTFAQTGTLYQGDKVTVLTTGKNWCYISGSAGTGYVKKSLISNKYVKKSGSIGANYTAYIVNPNGNTVNVRKGPGTGYGVDTELAPGTEIFVEKTQSGWSWITSPVTGWVMSSYISKTAPEWVVTPSPTPAPTPIATTQYITSENGKSVNLRHGPSETGYAVRATLPVGTEVKVISVENGWARVTAGDLKGYVKIEFLTATKPDPKATATPTPTPDPSAFKSFTAYVVNSNGGKVNMRTGAGKGFATIYQLTPGTKIKVTGESGGWYQIKYNNTYGYMMKEYISKKKP